MKKIKLLGLGSLFVSSLVTAAPACLGFELKLKNNLADELLITNVKLDGAEISPANLQRLKSKSEQVFIINNTNEEVPMFGEFVLHTISLSSKEVQIRYTLENKGLVCKHSQIEAESDLPVSKTREINKVSYTINP